MIRAFLAGILLVGHDTWGLSGVQTCYTPRERYAVRYHVVETCCPGWSDDGTGACNIANCGSPCQNEGTCSAVEGTPTCICQDGYHGDHCQHGKEQRRGTIGTSGKQLSPFSVEYLLSLEQQSQYMSTDGIEKRCLPWNLADTCGVREADDGHVGSQHQEQIQTQYEVGVQANAFDRPECQLGMGEPHNGPTRVRESTMKTGP
uniref:Uncharacterized protein n=1 Tax=Magallana gigas TaxID=29159 RepID=K1PWC4_MAGGI